MTDKLETIESGLFTLDETTRTARGLLVPFHEPTDPAHRHPTVFRPDTITIPADTSLLRANRLHELTDPVATFTAEETPHGIEAVFTIARTPEGDELISQHRAGELTHLSGEFRKLVKRGSEVLSGILTGAAFVPAGAFASAALFSLDPITETPETPESSPELEDPTPPPAAEPKEEIMPENGAVATVPGLPPIPADPQASVFRLMPERDDLFSLMQKVRDYQDPDAIRALAGIGERNLFALSDVKISGSGQLGTAAVETGWIGHVWEGAAYERVIVPLLTPGPLTKLTWAGWKWNAKPTMAAWAGNKAALTSAAVTATAVTGSAQRFAGGHDLAREFYDFNETEAIESYAQAMVESYAELSDNYALDQLIAGATAADADTYPGTVPDVLGKIVQGALAVIRTGKSRPTFAVLSEELFAQFIYTMRDNTLEYLASSAGLEGGTLAGMTIVPDVTDSLAADQVLVGARRAARALELPGSPVRVNALDLVNGGVDNAFFGYIGIQIDRATALSLISDPAS